VAHCPASNLKLGSGMAPVARLLAEGVNVGIGTDGAASNNRLDMLGEMRLAALLGKGVSGDPTALPAAQALEMATLAGARALGREQEIGSLAAGKQADIVAIDLARPDSQPCYDPLSDLVYSVGREQVSHVWVGGRLRVEDGICLGLDSREILRTAGRWKGLISRAK
jgi:5-methylthioadenosine/S-adenosylhomocysteine deaminase